MSDDLCWRDILIKTDEARALGDAIFVLETKGRDGTADILRKYRDRQLGYSAAIASIGLMNAPIFT